MKIKLRTRLGQNPAGAVIDTSDSEAQWLVVHGKALWMPVQDAETADAETADAEPYSEDEPQPAASEVTNDADEPERVVTLAELKTRAQELGVATYGTKAQIMERIDEAERGDTDG